MARTVLIVTNKKTKTKTAYPTIPKVCDDYPALKIRSVRYEFEKNGFYEDKTLLIEKIRYATN